VRYTIGIDLGTTNCALAYAEITGQDDRAQIVTHPLAQLVNPREVAERTLLPSFLFLPGELDFPEGSIALPWDPSPDDVVGELARARGAENPARLVSSAKSWLSYAGAERTAPILPFAAPAEVAKVSPVDASARYLAHLREVWNLAHDGSPEARFEDQDLLLTVPASFDEDARALTLQAAEHAGLPRVTLLEEPQAAFYAWIASQGERWRDRIRVGDLVLVCDVGGGTTDFSLIAVGERDGELSLERVAVGEHILLGGDNMDLALARVLQQRLESEGHRIDTWQLHGLWHQARAAKEALFARVTDVATSSETQAVTLLGRGRKLVGGTIKTTVSAADLSTTVVDGFFPRVERDARPARQRRVGFQELGLPYAADPAVTRHLASFLGRQAGGGAMSAPVRRGTSGMACPTHVLFNGGVMKARVLRDRIVEVLNTWVTAEGFEPLDAAHVLDAPDLDHAVARGAAYYGQARRGRGVRIRSGAPRTYYVGIESAMPAVPGLPAPLKALCVVPFGMEEGTTGEIPGRQFGLVVGEPAEFRFLSSTLRKTDAPGTLVEDWGEDIEELSPLEVTLRLDGKEDSVMPVTLESRVTEIGTLELWCVSRDKAHRWKLELNIRQHETSVV
jgi:hypothetical protein